MFSIATFQAYDFHASGEPVRMSELEVNTYIVQLQQVEAALTIDPENEELVQVKNKLWQGLIRTQDLTNVQLGAAPNVEAAALETKKLKQNKSRWTEDMIICVIPWKEGEDCQAIYPEDGAYHDATIEDINPYGEVIVKFKEYPSVFVTTLSLLKLPVNGIMTMYKTFTAKDMKEITAYRNVHLKQKQKEVETWKNIWQERSCGKEQFQDTRGCRGQGQ